MTLAVSIRSAACLSVSAPASAHHQIRGASHPSRKHWRSVTRATVADAMSLRGRNALITGASKGIGKAIALRLAREGANLALAARSEKLLTEVAEECRHKGAPQCHVFPIDLAKPDLLPSFAADVLAKVDGGKVDILVGDYVSWQQALNLNLYAPMVLTSEFSPGMAKQKYGRIINIASVAGVEPMAGTPIYASTKWGVRGYSLSAYSALRNQGIGVCCINPPAVRTDMTEGRGFKRDKILDPEDIAETMMLVFTTGANCVPQDLTLRLGLSAM